MLSFVQRQFWLMVSSCAFIFCLLSFLMCICVWSLLCSLSVLTNSAISHLFCVLCHCEEKQQQSCQLAKDRWRSFLPVQHKRKYNCKNRKHCMIICRITPFSIEVAFFVLNPPSKIYFTLVLCKFKFGN